MKNILAATILLVYAVSSGGIVLIEYSCHETGASGVTVPAPRLCYAPACDEEAPGEPDACCDHSCCEIDLRVSAPGDQIVGGPTDHSDAAATVVSTTSTFTPTNAAIGDPATSVTPVPPFPGYNRPIRI